MTKQKAWHRLWSHLESKGIPVDSGECQDRAKQGRPDGRQLVAELDNLHPFKLPIEAVEIISMIVAKAYELGRDDQARIDN